MRYVLCVPLFAALAALSQQPANGQGQERFAVVTIKNSTKGDMSFYRKWVWHYGKKDEKVHLDWRVTKIPPGKSYTAKMTYQTEKKLSPNLIVVFDSDRNKGAHWQMVELQRAADADGIGGFVYALEYDGKSKEYASLVGKNGGKVRVLDRKTTKPEDAQEIPFKGK